MTRHIPIGIKTSPQAVDWATLDAMWARIGDARRLRVGLDERPPDRHRATIATAPSLEALTAMAALVHHVPGRWVGHGRPVGDVPPPGGARQGRDGPRPRDRRPLHRRPRRRLARGRARLARHPAAADAASGSTASSRPSTCCARCGPGGRGTARGDPARPVLSARRGDQRAAAADAGRPAAVARRPEAPRHRAGGGASPTAGSMPAVSIVLTDRPTDLDDFSDRRDAILPRARGDRPRPGHASSSAPRSRPARPRDDRATGAGARRRTRVERGATHVILGLRPRLGPDGVDAVAREVAEPLRQAIG